MNALEAGKAYVCRYEGKHIAFLGGKSLVSRPVTGGLLTGVFKNGRLREGAYVLVDDEWRKVENLADATLANYSAWQRINGYAKVASYHYILQADFEKVCAYVRKQISMLRNMASAPSKDKDWRAKRIQAIKVRCKLQLKDEAAYRAYIQKNFQIIGYIQLRMRTI